jgi:hypothetical protein
MYRPDGLDQLLPWGRLENIAPRPGLDGLKDVFVFDIHRKDDNGQQCSERAAKQSPSRKEEIASSQKLVLMSRKLPLTKSFLFAILLASF